MQDITKTIDDILQIIPTDTQFLSLRTRIGNIRTSIQLDPNRMLKIGAADLSKLIANIPPQYEWKRRIDEYTAKVKAGETPDVNKQEVAPTPVPPAPIPSEPQVPRPVPVAPETLTRGRAYAWLSSPNKITLVNDAGVMLGSVDVPAGADPRTMATAANGSAFEIEWVEKPMEHEGFMRIMGYKAPVQVRQAEPETEKAIQPQEDKARTYLAMRAEYLRMKKSLQKLEAELFAG